MLNAITGYLVGVSEQTKPGDTMCPVIPLLGIYLPLQTMSILKILLISIDKEHSNMEKLEKMSINYWVDKQKSLCTYDIELSVKDNEIHKNYYSMITFQIITFILTKVNHINKNTCKFYVCEMPATEKSTESERCCSLDMGDSEKLSVTVSSWL